MTVVPIDLAGTVVLVEVDEEPINDLDVVSQGGLEDADSAIERLTDLAGSMRSTCVALHRAMVAATNEVKPDSMELTFGLKLGGEAGIPFVAKGTAEANFTVKLAWSSMRGPVSSGRAADAPPLTGEGSEPKDV